MARILLVDDDPTIREAYQIVLETNGYTVDAAEDGSQALKLAAANEPDLILLDLIMPITTGLQFLQKYDLTKHRKVKVILFSNSHAEDDAKEALALGAHRYVLKSKYTPMEAISLIQETLKG